MNAKVDAFDPSASRTSMGQRPRPPRPWWSGLFARVFVSFLLTVLVSMLVAGALAFRVGRAFGPEWYEPIFERIQTQNDELVAALDDPRRIDAAMRDLEDELDTRLVLHRDRKHVMRRFQNLPVGQARRLRRGEPVVLPPRAGRPPTLFVPLTTPGDHRPTALVEIHPPRRGILGPVAIFLAALASLGGGALLLSRFLTARLRHLQLTTQRLAAGDLSTRAPTRDAAIPDELDDLADAFNHMASRTQQLVEGQKTLLTNVSHELRTPVARVKVLLEILSERLELVDEAEPDQRAETLERAFDRVRKGLTELGDDVVEVESLIADLLTSGRMELGKDGALAIEDTSIATLLDGVATKFAAKVVCEPPELRAPLDAMLIERVVSNLLVNARRACPDGQLTVFAQLDADLVRIAVEDEGPGVPVDARTRIFEPFARLDAARNRDAGGAGLGLYLCRQIAIAHGGTIRVEDRPGGRRGARFVIELPATRP